jgi:hypothetical protein
VATASGEFGVCAKLAAESVRITTIAEIVSVARMVRIDGVASSVLDERIGVVPKVLCFLLRYHNDYVNLSRGLSPLGLKETYARRCPLLLAARASQIGNRRSSAAIPPLQLTALSGSSPAASPPLEHVTQRSSFITALSNRYSQTIRNRPNSFSPNTECVSNRYYLPTFSR